MGSSTASIATVPAAEQDINHLRELLSQNEVAVFVGAGVTIQATDHAPVASWTGLIASGISYIERASPIVDVAALRAELSAADGVDDYLAIADKVTFSLGGRDGFNFRAWLDESVGRLRATPEGTRLLKAIIKLRNPIVTTNYDDLLEQASGTWHPPYTWRDTYAIAEVMRNHRPGIVHLHGHYDRPNDVIFDQRSYIDLVRRSEYQEFRDRLASNRSFLFVGCGSGLDDPNFDRWRKVLQESSNALLRPCFRLCLESELPELARAHRYDPAIRLLPYGTKHWQLEEFLEKLAPPAPSNPRATANFIEPADTEHCGHEVRMSGTVSGLDGLTDLWLVKEVSEDNFHPDTGPVHRVGNTWSGTAYLGSRDWPVTTPQQYRVLLMTATPVASRRLQAYLNDCITSNSWPGIADLAGMTTLAEITVTRTR